MWYVNIVQEIIDKGAYVNVIGENEKMSLHLVCEDNDDGVILKFNLFFTSSF